MQQVKSTRPKDTRRAAVEDREVQITRLKDTRRAAVEDDRQVRTTRSGDTRTAAEDNRQVRTTRPQATGRAAVEYSHPVRTTRAEGSRRTAADPASAAGQGNVRAGATNDTRRRKERQVSEQDYRLPPEPRRVSFLRASFGLLVQD